MQREADLKMEIEARGSDFLYPGTLDQSPGRTLGCFLSPPQVPGTGWGTGWSWSLGLCPAGAGRSQVCVGRQGRHLKWAREHGRNKGEGSLGGVVWHSRGD
jgi:hypothetical protein